MARKAFLMRVDPAVLAAVQKWADDDLRSLNAQIEFILRQALTRRGTRLPPRDPGGDSVADKTGGDSNPTGR